MKAKTLTARFHYLEQALLRRLSDTLRPHPAVAHAVSAFVAQQGISSIATVVGETGLSSRRFIELFCREVGLPPKTFCRILRFQHVLQSMNAKSPLNLAAMALECGYYDQAHLNRDFMAFTGLTPTTYLASQGAYDNQVPLAEQGQIYPRPAFTSIVRY
jgi:AraC-like DNA-binding protein